MQRLSWLSQRFNPIFAAFLLIAFLSGIAGALLAPTLSLFLTTEVKVRPLWVGLFYTANAVAGIVVSFLLAKRSDTRGDRRMLILLCCLMAVGNCLLFAFNRDYLTLITAGVLMSAVANTAMPQIFALAREYADSEAREVVMFSSVMRAQLSLAWVVGPPLSFALALSYGFTVMFLIAAATFAACTLLVWFALPSVPRAEEAGDSLQGGASAPIAPASAWRNRDVRLLFVASMLMWTCNTMYIIDMPLYITADLGLPEKLAGLLMGTAAGLEIPAMLLAGYYVKRFGKRNMMLFAVLAGVLFYGGLVVFTGKTALIALQLLNAIFIGIVAGIGMLYFQDLMPGRPGAATTLFTNSISTGVILAGVLQGALVENLGHYAVYWLAALLAVAALWMSARVREV
ncbi:Sugar efflux transporter A [Serratia entomophila]|jgi:SET family sugar efflux transporter-like MFS transporter|uniref:sugar efflux transporter n=1 Tax=Serratia entomophila TaxID=42906 RepID=UPI0021794092|nr:sugar efflux transporter [Serratia entomophila]CAI0783129.1 Sugar efflux transporter A [Serratia entomophila]CAI0842003.1 Sugar efflux transporter A [Serratia entomophila]CAI1036379.1 Sugar efflux transporter A [Serratia entomophila]CAI1610532.1 Sugar efflux transporter A [Serratia entomophila]CAI1795352.1 Sugar efflux transporter A [Serratia entomophila]